MRGNLSDTMVRMLENRPQVKMHVGDQVRRVAIVPAPQMRVIIRLSHGLSLVNDQN